MKSKPKGAKYRNLVARSGVIYYQRVIAGRRIRFSCETNDWEAAVAIRDLYEQRKGVGRVSAPIFAVPTFGEFADRYLEEDTRRLANTTRADRKSHLASTGPLVRWFGGRRLDEVTSSILRQWWGAEVEGRGLSPSTGRHLLSTLSAVFGYATDLGIIERSPVADFREILRRHTRTKQGRAAAAGGDVNPIDQSAEINRLLAAAQQEDETTHALVLLMLDAGLRLGEAVAVTWEQVVWGEDSDDPARAIVVNRNRPRGGPPEGTKSGRERRVALSRRLRRTLSSLYLRRGRPPVNTEILGAIDPNNFRRREWRRVCKRARIGPRRMKDLRDSFASWLLSLGAPIPFVQDALGHADWATTARHYGKWIPSAGHRPPLTLERGEVWSDLLSRLPEKRPHTDPTALQAGVEASDGSQ